MELALRKLRKVFSGGVVALDEINLEVNSGELLVLFGPSGSGKSTLIRLVAGLEVPTSGTVWIGQEDATAKPPHERGVGLVHQRAVLYPHLSVMDNLRFGGHRPLDERIDTISRLLGIEELLGRRPGELSGGQLQRASLGRALVRQPRVLLLDEPFGSLDGPLRWELQRELHLLQRQLAATMILVTHEQAEALVLADRLAVLDRGRLVQIGSPGEVLHQPVNTLVARLLGWPPMNLLPGRLIGVEKKLVLDGGLTLPAPRHGYDPGDQRVILGLRPDHVRVGAQDGQHPDEIVVQMTLATVQPGGASGWAVVESGPVTLVGERVHPLTKDCPVALNLGASYLFDADTGQALGRRTGPAPATGSGPG